MPSVKPESVAMLDQNVAFRLDGERGFLHDRPAAQRTQSDRIPVLVGDREIGSGVACFESHDCGDYICTPAVRATLLIPAGG